MGTQTLTQLVLTGVVLVGVVAGAQRSRPLACHDPNRVCSAYLYYMLSSSESKADVASLFNVGARDLTLDPHSTALDSQGLFIRVNCSCFASMYLANASYNASSATTLASIIAHDYTNLAWAKNASIPIVPGSPVPISLLCGCLDNTREYGYLLSYLVQSQDTLSKLAARFESSISSVVLLNNITNENVIHNNQVYYLPINIAPLVAPFTPASVPVGVPPAALLPDSPSTSGTRFPLKMVLAIAGGTCVLILVAVGVLVFARNVVFTKQNNGITHRKGSEQRWNFCGGHSFKLVTLCLKGNAGLTKSSRRPVTISREIMTATVGAEKPIVYVFEEIVNATDNFKDSNVLGQGAFGIVYYGVLRDQGYLDIGE